MTPSMAVSGPSDNTYNTFRFTTTATIGVVYTATLKNYPSNGVMYLWRINSDGCPTTIGLDTYPLMTQGLSPSANNQQYRLPTTPVTGTSYILEIRTSSGLTSTQFTVGLLQSATTTLNAQQGGNVGNVVTQSPPPATPDEIPLDKVYVAPPPE